MTQEIPTDELIRLLKGEGEEIFSDIDAEAMKEAHKIVANYASSSDRPWPIARLICALRQRDRAVTSLQSALLLAGESVKTLSEQLEQVAKQHVEIISERDEYREAARLAIEAGKQLEAEKARILTDLRALLERIQGQRTRYGYVEFRWVDAALKALIDYKIFEPGHRVVYIPGHARGNPEHPDCERGVVRSVSSTGSTVFVVFDKDYQTLGEEAGAKACDPSDVHILSFFMTRRPNAK
jgi:hypothetical protein